MPHLCSPGEKKSLEEPPPLPPQDAEMDSGVQKPEVICPHLMLSVFQATQLQLSAQEAINSRIKLMFHFLSPLQPLPIYLNLNIIFKFNLN